LRIKSLCSLLDRIRRIVAGRKSLSVPMSAIGQKIPARDH
jgi:hypothetical protein